MSKRTEKKTVKIEGMHCASCVASVEKSLRKVPGVVTAVVNLATESASVEYQPDRAKGTDLKRAVENAGFRMVNGAEASGEDPIAKDDRKMTEARRKMILAWAVTIPIIIWMIPHMFFDYMFLGMRVMDISILVLAAFAVFVPGLSTIKSAFRSAVHLSPNMDALIAMGTLSSLATGVVAVLHHYGMGPGFPSFAGIGGMIMAIHLTGRNI
jgi:Cu+-exporting ATPase